MDYLFYLFYVVILCYHIEKKITRYKKRQTSFKIKLLTFTQLKKITENHFAH